MAKEHPSGNFAVLIPGYVLQICSLGGVKFSREFLVKLEWKFETNSKTAACTTCRCADSTGKYHPISRNDLPTFRGAVYQNTSRVLATLLFLAQIPRERVIAPHSNLSIREFRNDIIVQTRNICGLIS